MHFIIPEKAIRMILGKRRTNYSNWHFQKPNRMNKTICGIIIASGRGYKYRSKGFYSYLRHAKILWEGKKVKEIKKGKFCATCLGPLIYLY